MRVQRPPRDSQTKKVVLRLECITCKAKSQLTLKRCKHFELGGDKKTKCVSSNPSPHAPCLLTRTLRAPQERRHLLLKRSQRNQRSRRTTWEEQGTERTARRAGPWRARARGQPCGRSAATQRSRVHRCAHRGAGGGHAFLIFVWTTGVWRDSHACVLCYRDRQGVGPGVSRDSDMTRLYLHVWRSRAGLPSACIRVYSVTTVRPTCPPGTRPAFQ